MHNFSLDCAMDLIQVPVYSLKQGLSFGTPFMYIWLRFIKYNIGSTLICTQM